MRLLRLSIITAIVLVTLVLPYSVHAGVSETLGERVRETTLDNGLKVVVVERHASPVFFTLVSFRVGSSHEQPNHSGLSHFLEHMLFKGTETIGTNNYKKEKPIMEKLERAAIRVKELQITMQEWRYDMFEEYATKVKSELPEETRTEIGGDESAGWTVALESMPTDIVELPEEWQSSPWLLQDSEHNYWELYQEMLQYRIKMLDLIVEQRQYIVQTEIDGIYDVHGARMINAFTSQDQTTYLAGLPSNCLELWMYLESDRFVTPVFREFYSEREVVREEKRMRSSEPWSVLMKSLTQTAYQAHPYGKPVIGWDSDLRLALRSDMEKHFKRYYAPNNCQLTIVGDVDTEQVFKLAKEYFGPWKPSEVAHEITVSEPEQIGERRVVAEFDAEPQMMIGFHAPVGPHPDYYALNMLSQILSSGRTSRFYKSIFVEQGLTNRAPWASSPDGRYAELFTIGATPKAPHSVEEVEAAIQAELNKLKTELVTDRELERAHNRYKSWQLGRLRSNQWLAFSLSGAFINHGDWRAVVEEYDRMMLVTPEEIKRVANKYFKSSNMTVATLKKPEEIATVTAEMGGNE